MCCMKAEDLICAFRLVPEMGKDVSLCLPSNHAEHYHVKKNKAGKVNGVFLLFFYSSRQKVPSSAGKIHSWVRLWASVLGCVSLLSLSSLLCISLGNDFGDASSPLTATLAS